MFKQLTKYAGVLSVLLLTTACSTTSTSVKSTKADNRADYLYLYGNFNWWTAEPEYLVERVESQTYKTTVELVADGVHYEFKFADKVGSRGINCGYANKARDGIVVEGRKAKANCFAEYEHFRFTPKETGKYDFYIDFSYSDENPKVWITPHQGGLFF